MNRADMTRQALIWDAVAVEARRRSGIYRDQLADAARTELAEQGVAPTWRLPDLATVTLPVSRETAYVADLEALTKWAAARHPAEMEETLRPAFVAALLSRLATADGIAVDHETGEVIPGVGVRPGGQPGSLTIKATAAAKPVVAHAVEDIVSAVAGALDEPHEEQP